MKVRVVSCFRLADPRASAARFGADASWQGDVPGTRIEAEGDPEAANDRIYQHLQRVEPGDGLRLEATGYLLPSLSAGDLLIWQEPHVRMFLVEARGFREVTPGLGSVRV